MPAVSEQFGTFHQFAKASLSDIYGKRLATAYQVKANHLESGTWINETPKGGSIKFRWQAFPLQAQLSPINAIATGDFNADGQVELILAQNHHSNQVETGLWRGTPGCHLEWQGDRFVALRLEQSGIELPGDTKAISGIRVDTSGKQGILAAQNDDGLLLFLNSR